MLRLVYVLEIEAEEQVREQVRAREIGQARVDHAHGDQAHEEVEAHVAEPAVRVPRPDDAVLVRIEELAVLLEDSLVRVLRRVLVRLRAVRRGRR